MSKPPVEEIKQELQEWHILAAGATAGLVVDTSLYPIDTIKSRLQSAQGFIQSGGFKHLYRGLPPVLIQSVPSAALFFITYETVKNRFETKSAVIEHLVAASSGEVVSCSFRVPFEIIKMRSQTHNSAVGPRPSNIAIFKHILISEGVPGLYRGFRSTIYRDLPFSALQYPIWERLKLNHRQRFQRNCNAYESALYGSIAGAIAAFMTNPLDVAKSRIMLAGKNDPIASGNVPLALRTVFVEKGTRGLFAGVVPRVFWISVGAAIFLGSYERALSYFS